MCEHPFSIFGQTLPPHEWSCKEHLQFWRGK